MKKTNPNYNPLAKLSLLQILFYRSRTLVLYLLMTILSIVLFMVMLILIPLGWRIRMYIYHGWCKTAVHLIKIICGIKLNVQGKINIKNISYKNKNPVIFISNHQSLLETLVLPSILPPIVYVLKKELFYVPFFGWGLYLSKNIGIDRSKKTNALRQVLTKGKESLKLGLSVLVFPEGTRTAPFKLNRFQKSGAMLAHSANVPIIPIALDSAFCWPNKKIIAIPGTVNIIIGPKINTKDIKTQQAHELATKWILDKRSYLESKRI